MLVLDSSSTDAGNAFLGFLFLVGGVALYFLPTLIAMGRGNLNKGAVFVIDLFLGWSVIGWVVALAMAASGQTKKQAEANRPIVHVAPMTPPTISPDGRYWWDGRQWQALPTAPMSTPPTTEAPGRQ
jgi:hypothetical protein